MQELPSVAIKLQLIFIDNSELLLQRFAVDLSAISLRQGDRRFWCRTSVLLNGTDRAALFGA